MGGTEMTRGTTQDPWPDEPDDQYPDFLWPDDDEHDDDGHDYEQAGRPEASDAGARWGSVVPPEWAVPPDYPHDARDRRRRIVALSVTAVVAVGLGAGAVYVYRNAEDSTTPAASASSSPAPGQSGGYAGPGEGSGSQGVTTQMELVGKVTALGPGTITFAGGPMPAVKAAVTSATRFTGSVRTLAAVRVGDIVAAQILVSGDAARVVTLQDPASES
jgi:hypothetical protein